AEGAVAADARVGRLATRVALDERGDDRAPELLTQVEGDVRQAERMAGLAGLDHGAGRAAGALGLVAARVDPQAERDADGARSGLEQRDGTVDPTAHRYRDPRGIGSCRDGGPERVRERVGRERLPGHGGRLEQRQPGEIAL